jgi:hypothetical protein
VEFAVDVELVELASEDPVEESSSPLLPPHPVIARAKQIKEIEIKNLTVGNRTRLA